MRVNYYIKNRLDSPCMSAVYINCGNRASRVNGVSVALRLDIAKPVIENRLIGYFSIKTVK